MIVNLLRISQSANKTSFLIFPLVPVGQKNSFVLLLCYGERRKVVIVVELLNFHGLKDSYNSDYISFGFQQPSRLNI